LLAGGLLIAGEPVSTRKHGRATVMQRIPDITESDLSPAQRKVHDAIIAGPRGAVRGPLRIWLHSPELAERAQELGAFCRYHSSLPARLSELAILVIGAFWKAGYEWNVHAPLAQAAGIPPEAIEAIRHGREPRFDKADEAAVYAFARELLERRRVSDQAFRDAEAALGTRGIVDLIGVLGYYGLIAMTIAAAELPAGGADPFA
jgi:4-carboxymuconolactone decarboxylase